MRCCIRRWIQFTDDVGGRFTRPVVISGSADPSARGLGVRDDSVHLAEHWRADESHRRRYIGMTHRFDVFDARVAESTRARL